jgi:hypothetical protein
MRTQPSTEETDAVRTRSLEVMNDDKRDWQLALPKKYSAALDDRPANGCHRNAGIAISLAQDGMWLN